MAAQPMTRVQLELIQSLSQEDIPIKLRCAICSKLAVNAFRLPCCEQAICENCQQALPKDCPVCEHTPVTPDDCTPHKSLRTTIKVFLRTEEKKRGAFLAKAAKQSPPETPVEATPSTALPETIPDDSAETVPPTTEGHGENAVPAPQDDSEGNGEGQIKEENTGDNTELAVIPAHSSTDQEIHESIEEIAPGQEHDEDKSNVDDASTIGEGVDGTAAVAGAGAGGMMVGATGMGMNPIMGMMAGMNGMSDMSQMNQMQQMQMMMAMQGGMGGFPMMGMMGMPGLPMDPMAMQNMQSMYGGFGGMGAMGGMMGGNSMGANNMGGYQDGNQGGYGGQQAWNTGVDNFNANNAAGSSTNHHDFASNYRGRGGYGAYNNDFSYRGRGGRGRGRGGFGGGRGGWNQAAEFQNSGWQGGVNGMGEQVGEEIPKRVEVNPNVDEFGREIRAVTPDAEGEGAKTSGEGAADDNQAGATEPETNGEHNQQNGEWNDEQNGEYNDASYDPSYDQTYNQGYDASYNQQYNGYNQNQNMASAPPVDIPINAPTGPKAMREGLPNIGLVHLKGRKQSTGRPYSSGSGANQVEVADRTKRESRHEDRDKYAEDREREAERRERRERRHRDGHDERSEDEKESERRRERRRRRREEAEAAAGDVSTMKDDNDGDAMDRDGEDDRVRSASPAESKRESHRSSRRDKDRSERHSDRDRERHRDRSRHRDRDDKDRSDRSDRDREREKDKDYKSSRSERSDRDKHRSSRSHRDRSRSRDRSDRKEDDTKSRSSRRERDRDSDRHSTSDHRSSRRHRDEDRERDTAPVLKPPTGPKSMSIFDNGPARGGGIQIKGASSRPLTSTHANSSSNLNSNSKSNGASKSSASGSAKPKEIDPHTAEREARNRERLLKEAQRMAGLAGLVGVVPSGPRKREREEERGGGRRKRRGKSGGGFDDADERVDVGGAEDEERIRRNELEREGARGR